MRLGRKRDVARWLGVLAQFGLLLGLPACGGLIKIEVIPTATSRPIEPIQTPATVEPIAASGLPVRLISQAIGLDSPVVAMGWRSEERGGQVISEWVVPENEAGWHRNSARPGQGSNIVISGHNNSSGGRVFANLDELEVGNQITVVTDEGKLYDYQISDKQIVRAFGASQETLDYLRAVIQPTQTEQLTLISCWPSWTNTHRLIIIAKPL